MYGVYRQHITSSPGRSNLSANLLGYLDLAVVKTLVYFDFEATALEISGKPRIFYSREYQGYDKLESETKRLFR